MPMIDVYAASGTFADTRRLAVDLATTLMTIEKACATGGPRLGVRQRRRVADWVWQGTGRLCPAGGPRRRFRMHVVIVGGHTRTALLPGRLVTADGHEVTGIVRDPAQGADLSAGGMRAAPVDLAHTTPARWLGC
jgi:hypothetical protein